MPLIDLDLEALGAKLRMTPADLHAAALQYSQTYGADAWRARLEDDLRARLKAEQEEAKK